MYVLGLDYNIATNPAVMLQNTINHGLIFSTFGHKHYIVVHFDQLRILHMTLNFANIQSTYTWQSKVAICNSGISIFNRIPCKFIHLVI